MHAAAQTRHIGAAVGTLDAVPAVVGLIAQFNSPLLKKWRACVSGFRELKVREGRIYTLEI
jgi:hypothetical protein